MLLYYITYIGKLLIGQSISVVLGGGGQKAAAHIGIIEKLISEDVPIDMISGTSAGAFIAAVYAMTRDIKTVEAIVKQNSIKNLDFLFDLTLPVYSIFTGKILNDSLTRIFGLERDIEDLWIPFFCISTDISACKMRIHNTGSVWRYVRGSMSIAGVFSPICDPVDGHYLVDGGYVNNVPADIAMKLGAERVIAIDVSHTITSKFSNFGDALRTVLILIKI